MRSITSISIVLILFITATTVCGQQLTLDIKPADSSTAKIIKRLNYNSRPASKLQAQQELNKVLHYFIDKGYITASMDSIYEDSSSISGWLYTGDVYHMSVIRPGNAPGVILSQSGYKEKLYSSKPFNINEIYELTEDILSYCENNGYPFASVSLDSVCIHDDKSISASLNLKLMQQVIIDTIIVKGNSKLHRKFIRNYFNIKQGDLYDESRIIKIEAKLQDLPFISVIKPHEVVFIDDKARLILYIDKKRASQFDGILGIAPNDDVSGKLLLTGDIKLKLLSAFNRGELIDFNWRKLEAKSQDLNFHFNFPFLFNTPFGLDYRLHLFKKDTSYLNLTNNLGIQVMFSGYNYVKAFYENLQSNLLSTAGLEFATSLPEYADITTSLYGLGLEYSKLDYRFNPQKGYHIDLSGAIGSKKIRKNSNVNQALYDSIPLNSTLYRLQLNAALYVPLFRSSTLLIGNKSGFLENKNLFDNELFRIGGLKTLRGFDEESITASIYSIFTLEFRYLFDVNSFFHVFFDGAYYEHNANSGYLKDTPYGFGAGVNFETRAGIFALSYALGSRDGQ
ncbi:MAG: BamA/TamA family outer membrane protein, partial [Bacteroidales bacterium]|nr:BamA/TamA family outer membrane protein [Bacteroidales bacterium]